MSKDRTLVIHTGDHIRNPTAMRHEKVEIERPVKANEAPTPPKYPEPKGAADQPIVADGRAHEEGNVPVADAQVEESSAEDQDGSPERTFASLDTKSKADLEKMAKDLNIEITGSGSGGNVTKADLVEALRTDK